MRKKEISTVIATAIAIGLLVNTSVPAVVAEGEVDCEELLEEVVETQGDPELLEEFAEYCEAPSAPIGVGVGMTTYAYADAIITGHNSEEGYCVFEYEGNYILSTGIMLPLQDSEEVTYSWWAEDSEGHSRSARGQVKVDEDRDLDGEAIVNGNYQDIAEFYYEVAAELSSDYNSKDVAPADASDEDECLTS